MKKIGMSLALFIAITACSNNTQDANVAVADSTVITEAVVETEALPEKKKPKSPRMQSANQVQGAEVMIDYGSPYVKGRTIWGELVPFNKVWRAGANETTKLMISNDMKINGKPVSAGTYGLLIEPKTEGNWTVILNEAWDYDKHGIWGSNGYEQENDVLRLEVTPKFVDEIEESLSFSVEADKLAFAWEYARFEMSLAKK